MRRYAVWMLPVLAWLIVDALPDTRALRIGVIGAVALQALIVVSFNVGNDSLQVKAPARWVWNVAPALYNPEPMIFRAARCGQRLRGLNGLSHRLRRLEWQRRQDSGRCQEFAENAAALPAR